MKTHYSYIWNIKSTILNIQLKTNIYIYIYTYIYLGIYWYVCIIISKYLLVSPPAAGSAFQRPSPLPNAASTRRSDASGRPCGPQGAIAGTAPRRTQRCERCCLDGTAPAGACCQKKCEKLGRKDEVDHKRVRKNTHKHIRIVHI